MFTRKDPSPYGPPRWALERIRKAKQEHAESLDLSPTGSYHDEKLAEIPREVFGLSNLRRLNLRSNQLGTIPGEITSLSNLTDLDVGYNLLSTIPESITQLPNLKGLSLRGNQLSAIPALITQLPNLLELDLSYNQLHAIPATLLWLEKLKELDLSYNQLSTIPDPVTRLPVLTALNLSGNQISTIPDSIARLQTLSALFLGNNQISTIPDSIAQLPNLKKLSLGVNRLGSMPDAILLLEGLEELDLSYNQLSTISDSITHLQKLTWLVLIGNPLISPPVEIASDGVKAIRQYFQQLNREGEDRLYEAKLLILGEGGAGKTTFANKILDENYVLKEEEDTTRGVDVLQWSFPVADGRQFRVNIWDFGGQAIYHATHQFFLTRRSLYALVADTRRDDTDFYYWLNVAELLGDGSPLLIVKNEKQDRHREINERQLKGQFDCLKKVLATNLSTNGGLQEVVQEVQYYIRRLPHIGTPLPKTWVHVRELLEEDPRDYISVDEYMAICRANGFSLSRDILQLSGYLHDIGVFLHFQDDPLLKRIVILKPRWGTDAVYKVLENLDIIRNLGRFNQADLEAIWIEPEYESMRMELFQLMMKFRLCYEIPTQKGFYIAPQLLTENQPVYPWDGEDNLLLRYSYEFMPKGILTQFIVVMHPYIFEHKTVWKSGVVIEKDNTRAEVIEYYDKREIHVRVDGMQARELMTEIRYELKKIHDSFRRLKYDELIRCNCPACRESLDPYFFAIATLMKFKAANQLQIQCQNSFSMVNVMGLLGDVLTLTVPTDREPAPIINHTEIRIESSTIYGSVVAADTIQDSFNIVNYSSARGELKEQLKLLAQTVNEMVKKLPKEQAEEAADDLKRLAEEAIKEKPNAKWYCVSIDGLIAAAQNAQNLGKVGDAVIELAGKVGIILSGGSL